MAQSAAQPFIDMRNKLYGWAQKLEGSTDDVSPFKSQHQKEVDAVTKRNDDKAVEDANATYRKQGVGAKIAPKPAKKKATKKAASKRYGK